MKHALVLVFAVGCGRDAVPIQPGDHAALIAAPASADDAIVATVGDLPIYASEIARQATSAQTDARTALAALVDAEALAVAAQARGLGVDADVIAATKAAEIRRFVQTGFEREVTPDKLPDVEMKNAYETNRRVFDHVDAVEVSHILAEAGKDATPAQRRAAYERIAALAAPAAAAMSDEAFAALAKAPLPGQRALTTEHLTFPRHDVVEEPFAAAAFALTHPGQVSPIVETSYGYHLIRLTKRLPERHLPWDAVKDELRAGAFPPWQKREFEAYVATLARNHHIEQHFDRLPKEDPGLVEK